MKMTDTITQKLIDLGFEVTKPIIPIANYVQSKSIDCSIFLSGQLPIKDGEIAFQGKVGEELSIEDGKKAAELCMLNALNQLIVALDDDINKINSCIKLEVYINCKGNFERHAEVANGASDLIIKVLGERGKHTRTTIGVSSLPLNSAVEVTAIFETSKLKDEGRV